LAARFGLTTDDVRDNNNRALMRASQKGHQPVVQWLIETYALTIADARSVSALKLVYEWGRTELAQWLVARFAFAPNEIRDAKRRAKRANRARKRALEQARERLRDERALAEARTLETL